MIINCPYCHLLTAQEQQGPSRFSDAGSYTDYHCANCFLTFARPRRMMANPPGSARGWAGPHSRSVVNKIIPPFARVRDRRRRAIEDWDDWNRRQKTADISDIVRTTVNVVETELFVISEIGLELDE